MEFLIIKLLISQLTLVRKNDSPFFVGEVLKMKGKQVLDLGGHFHEEQDYFHDLKVSPTNHSLAAAGNIGNYTIEESDNTLTE